MAYNDVSKDGTKVWVEIDFNVFERQQNLFVKVVSGSMGLIQVVA
jgi:hypothetical protein